MARPNDRRNAMAQGNDRKIVWIALAIALTLAAAHIFATWAHVGAFWGDSGRWMHEVERFANGERVYRDFMWIFPPFAIWVVGGIARIVGPDLLVIMTITSVLYLTVVAVWVVFAARLVPRPLLLAVVPLGVLLASAYAMIQSAPLPVGMYTPAAPVGGLMILLGLNAAMKVREAGSVLSAAILGICTVGCLLSKQDFWLPALVLVLGVAAQILLAPSQEGRRARLMVGLVVPGLVALMACLTPLLLQNDLETLPLIATGFGAAALGGARALPAVNQLVFQVGVLSAIAAIVFASALLANEDRSRKAVLGLMIAGVIAATLYSVWVWQAMRIGSEVTGADVLSGLTPLQDSMRMEQPSTFALFKRAIRALLERIPPNAVPLLLPVALLCVAVVRRRRWSTDSDQVGLLILLLSVCVAARVRRGFEHTEWYQLLLELPVGILFMSIALRHYRYAGLRIQRALLAVLALVASIVYWNVGTGFLTARGRGVMTASARGHVWLRPNVAFDLSALRAIVDSIDPGGTRPLFSTGLSSGFNYHLGRPSPSPLTFGFSYRNRWNVDSLVDLIVSQRPRVLLIDHPYSVGKVAARRWAPLAWERPVEWGRQALIDRPQFERILRLCRGGRVGGVGVARVKDFSVIDCQPLD